MSHPQPIWRAVKVAFMAITMATMGAVSTASNMAFRIVRTIVPINTSNAQIGENWVSLPYLSPYSTVADFCTKTGLPALHTVIRVFNPQTGGTTPVTCGTSSANVTALTPGQGIVVRQSQNASSIVIIGSHDPTVTITAPLISNVANIWFSVPYNTTAVTFADLCTQAHLPSSTSTITRLDALTGVSTTVTCGTSAAGTTNLRLGEMVKLSSSGTAINFTPAYF